MFIAFLPIRFLNQHNVAMLSSQAGHFFMLDLRKYLAENTFAGEKQLYMKILDKANVNLTPGECFKFPVPGFFRCCFVGCNADTLVVALTKLLLALGGEEVVL